MRAGLPALAAAVSLAGCQAHQGEQPTQLPVEAREQAEAASDAPGLDPCGSPDERLDGLSWVPSEARLTALIELNDDELEVALQALRELARRDDHGLPMDVAFGLAHWDFQVPLLRTTLRRAGFEPAELAVLRFDDIGTVWVFGSSCDLDVAIERVESAWNIEVRRTSTGAMGRPRDEHPFAFDVVFLPGDRIAMAPADRGVALTRLLAGGSPPPGDAPRPGTVVETLEPAPIRAFVHGPAVASTPDATVARRLRGTGEGIEIDGSLAPSP
jgi:hypothetical protein